MPACESVSDAWTLALTSCGRKIHHVCGLTDDTNLVRGVTVLWLVLAISEFRIMRSQSARVPARVERQNIVLVPEGRDPGDNSPFKCSGWFLTEMFPETQLDGLFSRGHNSGKRLCSSLDTVIWVYHCSLALYQDSRRKVDGEVDYGGWRRADRRHISTVRLP